MVLKDWFENKLNNELNGGFLVSINNIKKETDKAYLVSLTWGYTSSLERDIDRWIPKSATMTKEEYQAEQEQQYKKANKGLEYNKLLVKFCKDNGVKGARVGLRTETLINKIKNANLNIPIMVQ